MSRELTIKMVTEVFKTATKSADLWIQQWRQYKDVSSIRNASFAIGKMAAIFNLLCSINGEETDLPEDIVKTMQEYTSIWDNLTLDPKIAEAIAKHGN